MRNCAVAAGATDENHHHLGPMRGARDTRRWYRQGAFLSSL